MAICRDCIHFDVCRNATIPNPKYKGMLEEKSKSCCNFKPVPLCKVGDTIWYELYGEIVFAVVYSCVGVLTRQGFVITDANAKSCDGLEIAFNGKCLGKTVFLTREEAEQALKGDAE